jgi:hypothetical protein
VLIALAALGEFENDAALGRGQAKHFNERGRPYYARIVRGMLNGPQKRRWPTK